MRYSKQLRLIIGAVIFLVLVFAAWGVYNSIVHRGKIGVKVQTVPGDAQVLVNGKPLSSSTAYLEPGTYTFTATKEGFEKSTVEIAVKPSRRSVSLTLPPVSDEAQKWAAENQGKYEEIGSQMIDERVLIVEDENPLLNKMPYDDIMGPFSINYEFASETDYKAKMIIRNSTPSGRIKALQWIREQGVDPADLNIEFEDFHNPTNQGDL